LRGFPASQVDLSIRRRLRLPRPAALEIGADAFNVLNHPNFSDPDPSLGNGPLFGISSTMLNESPGGLNPVYQMGGPRTIQLTLRLKM
jgi:hypothetical protein